MSPQAPTRGIFGRRSAIPASPDRAPAPSDPRRLNASLADLWALEGPLGSTAHRVSVSDRTHGAFVPEDAAQIAHELIEAALALTDRLALTPQAVSIRAKIERGQLELWVHTSSQDGSQDSIPATEDDLAGVRRHATSVGASFTPRQTAGGQWVSTWRIPIA